jgi:hypothetical protein
MAETSATVPAHFDEVRRLRHRIGDGVFVADDGGETRKQGGIDRFTRLVVQFIEHQAFPAKYIPLINDSACDAAQARFSAVSQRPSVRHPKVRTQ